MAPKSELALQQQCFIHFHNTYPALRGLLFHVNNNSVSGKSGALAKAIGVVPGVSDFLFIYNGTVYCIELKNEVGSQQLVQHRWQKKVEEQGIRYIIVRSVHVFALRIKEIVNKQL